MKANWQAIAQSMYEKEFPEIKWDNAESQLNEFLAKAPANVLSLVQLGMGENIAPPSDESSCIAYAKKINSIEKNSNNNKPTVEDLRKNLEVVGVVDDWEDLL